MALAILGISKLITTLTTLSISAIATNLKMRVGGVYFMISRVLGPDFGGSIGITLFIAQAVSVAFYTIGFTEAVFSLLAPAARPADAVGHGRQRAHGRHPPAPDHLHRGRGRACSSLTFKGADVAIKAQYGVLAVLLHVGGELHRRRAPGVRPARSSRPTRALRSPTEWASGRPLPSSFPRPPASPPGPTCPGISRTRANRSPGAPSLAIVFTAGDLRRAARAHRRLVTRAAS